MIMTLLLNLGFVLGTFVSFADGTTVDLEPLLDPDCVVYGFHDCMHTTFDQFQHISMDPDRFNPQLVMGSRCVIVLVPHGITLDAIESK